LPDHDQHFKKLIETCFADLVRIVAPRIAPRLHLDRPTFLDKEQFTDTREGEHRRLDLVAEVPSIRGDPELVIVHVEVEAQARRTMGRRLLNYAMQLWLRHGAPIVPVVVYLRGGKPDVTRERVPLRAFNTTFFTFRYFAFGLSPSQAREYLARREPLAWALAALMQRGGRSPEQHRLACLQPIARAEIDDARKVLLASCVETYVQLNESQREAYETLLDREENREVAAMERTLLTTLDRAAQQGYAEGLERGIEKGMEKGLAEGELKGREQGKRELLLDLLGRRFGPLPDATVQRVQALSSPEELSRLAERVLDARSLDDLGL
jgi:hypothetical protein